LTLARRHDAAVHVAHVLVPHGRDRNLRIGICEDVTEREAARNTLEAWIQSGESEDARCRTVLCEGALWECISSLIVEHGIDLLVIATKGATGPVDTLLGAQAEEIFREAACPVLMIGPHVTLRTERDFGQVLFATDLSDASMRAYPNALELAAGSNGRVTVLHVVASGGALHEYDPAWSDHLRSVLSAYGKPVTSDVVVAHGVPLNVILHYAHRLPADLIVMGLHRASRCTECVPWTLAHRIVSDAPCPILTIRS
jgi:nucleotide-binding universal stress UspA family protein